jgi:hypothetical protein
MNYKLTIGWLYPELMNIYGDRGNATALTKRCQWRGIETEMVMLDLGFFEEDLNVTSCSWVAPKINNKKLSPRTYSKNQKFYNQ